MLNGIPKAAGAVALLLLLSVVPATAQGPGYPELTRDEELRLAMSAGPLSVSRDADVYVMGRSGFELAIAGSNGFSCLVVRSAADKRQLAPHCLNPYATESALPAYLREGELQARGMDSEAVSAELARGWESGELPLPAGPAYAYMLSEGQRIGPRATNFRPHFMLYMPYVKNSDIGGDPGNMAFPFVGPFEDHPLATVVILMDEFVSPDSVALPDHR